jgi:hypothetical protein
MKLLREILYFYVIFLFLSFFPATGAAAPPDYRIGGGWGRSGGDRYDLEEGAHGSGVVFLLGQQWSNL